MSWDKNNYNILKNPIVQLNKHTYLERLVFPLVAFYSVEQVQVQEDSLEAVRIPFLG